jgi:hypothetical protein
MEPVNLIEPKLRNELTGVSSAAPSLQLVDYGIAHRSAIWAETAAENCCEQWNGFGWDKETATMVKTARESRQSKTAR